MYSKIYIANDHAGVECKQELMKYLTKKEIQVVNLGTDTNDSVNYADYAKHLANYVINDQGSLGIIICGTGIGVSMAANKLPGTRCALIYNKEVAKLAKQHNDANILAFGARQFKTKEIIKMIEAFLSVEFEGGRHQERINSIG